MSSTLKLTPALLRRIVREEKARIVAEAKKKMREADDTGYEKTTELGPEDQADGVVHAIDQAKAQGIKNEAATLHRLTVEEAKLVRQLRQIRESKSRVRSRIKRNV